jgi:hypothetical protein
MPRVIARRIGVRRQLKSLATGVLVSVLSSEARAAELRVRAPSECDLEATLREDTERLTGAPISEASNMDFEIEVEAEEQGGFTLELVSIERSRGTRRVRELRGASCSEVTNAGAVALALAIQQASDPESEPEPSAEPETAPVTAVEPRSAAEREPEADRAIEQRPAAEREPVSFGLGAGLLVDSSALPRVAPGAGVELGLRYSGFRFAAVGSWFAPQHAAVDAGRGGDFELLAAGLLVCREAAVGRVTPLGCAGYEIGSLRGEGTGVARSRLGAALWQAARLEAGAMARLGALGFEGRAGIAVPLERRDFVLDGTDVVHRPGGLSARLYLGLDSTF